MSLLRPVLLVALAAAASAFGAGSTRAADPAARATFVEACPAGQAPGAVPVTAFGLEAAPSAMAGPAHVVVLVDTSASQTGVFRQRTLDAVAGLLEAARPEDRFALATVDVACTPAVAGFHPADSDAMRAAARGLDAKTPLGSTDLLAALDAAIDLFGDRQGTLAVVYVGDGPALGGIDADEFSRAVDALRSRRVAVSSIGVGPQVNWPCLASLAGATGGMLFVPGEDDPAKQAGSRIGGQAVQPVCWPEAVAVVTAADDAATRLLPARLPPLRADRDSVVLVEGQLADARIEVTLRQADGRTQDVAIAVPAAAPRDENAYLAELARNARGTDGVFLPLLGRDSLDVARDVIRGEAATLAAMSRQAEAAGAADSARRLAEASLRRDPDNPEAAIIREVSQRRAAPAAEFVPAAPPAADPPELAEMQGTRRVRGQVLERETALRIREARDLLATDPDRSRELLKESQLLVSRSDDLDAADKDRMLRELEMRIRESIVRSREKVDRDVAAERRAAIGRDRMRLNDELRRRENRIQQLTERYNALVEEGIRDGYAQPESYPAVINGEAVIGYETPSKAPVEAERVVGEEIAKEAPDLWAGHPVPMTARVVGRTAPLVARILDYDTENVRTRRDQQRGFMDTLHLVDAAAIPFPDEPPIIYPTAERWREISRLREKYKSVDLANPTKNEKRIYESLEKEVSRTFDFQETPLRAVISQLQDEFNIQIVPDMQALTDAGIDLDATTVTQKLQGVSLRSALRLLLREPGLTYVIKDEVLLITTKEKAQENLVVKVYPVADLVLPVNPSSGLNPFQTGGGLGGQNSINSGMNMGGMGGGGLGGGMGGGIGGGGMF
ncbi:MAG: VWA domain-containing protein, partial [Planctomycetaceae bacterium]